MILVDTCINYGKCKPHSRLGTGSTTLYTVIYMTDAAESIIQPFIIS